MAERNLAGGILERNGSGLAGGWWRIDKTQATIIPVSYTHLDVYKRQPSITVSLGVATYPEDGDNILNVVEASDNALLTAKKSGKNTTVMYK